ncbi:MAG TPA: hypothetical protein VKG63_15545 [Steroidobacteraceae bacterium]|nr:hypothetical protein [Steroidobacteraceae bacterium]
MGTDTQAQQQIFVELRTEPSPAADAVVKAASDAADRARSEENILKWKSYLPADCVESMIAMGWDVST